MASEILGTTPSGLERVVQMTVFTFFKYHHKPSIPEFEIEDFVDLEAAKAHARGLITRYGHNAVEIFDGQETVKVTKGS